MKQTTQKRKGGGAHRSGSEEPLGAALHVARVPEKSLARFAEAQAVLRLETLHQNLQRAATNPEKAKTIHELRVSIRRFTRVLRVFRLLWDRAHYRKMRRRLRELMDACGAVRNCDVAVDVLESAAGQLPDPSGSAAKGPTLRIQQIYQHAAGRCAHLRTRYIPKRRTKAEENLAELLRHWKAEETSKPWLGWLRVNWEHDQDLQTFVRHTMRPLVDEYFESGDRAARSDATFEEMHKFRLLAKQLRYSLEIFGPASGREWKQGTEEVRAMQDLLGAINDCVTTRALIAGSGQDGSNILVKLLTNWRLNAFRRSWESDKKSRTWWLRWLCRRQRPRKTAPKSPRQAKARRRTA